MSESIELSSGECRELLATGAVGRVAFTTSNGPRIVPVSYTIVEEAIIFRTTAYSELGTHGPNTEVAFEVDQLDYGAQAGWSVVATGRAEAVEDFEAIQAIRLGGGDPTPWAAGSRQLYFQLRWRELTGRRLGPR